MVDDGNGNPVRACVKGGKIGGKIGGTASVGSHGAQMANGGIASMKKKKESPPRDASYKTDCKMASSDAAANDHEQTSSEGGKIGGKIGGIASMKKKKESPPRDASYKMASGDATANDHKQMSSEGAKIGGTASVGSHGAQMANGGIASMKKKKEGPPRDASYKMASGLGAASDHAQTSSEGGAAATLANAQRRQNEDGQSAYTIEPLEGDNMPYARGLGLGDHLL
jgi:hypothetical protein